MPRLLGTGLKGGLCNPCFPAGMNFFSISTEVIARALALETIARILVR